MSKEESKYGFKDKAKAEESLELLKSEDHKYQVLTVRGLLGRAKRVLTRKYAFLIDIFSVSFSVCVL